jgi:hypothetical protein
MNYELAKELKDAGFPQITTPEPTFDFPTSVYVPTLEELIEACGEQFDTLRQYEIGRWFAAANVEDEHGNREEVAGWPDPVTTVARLWLSLNQKKGSQK